MADEEYIENVCTECGEVVSTEDDGSEECTGTNDTLCDYCCEESDSDSDSQSDTDSGSEETKEE